MDEEFIDSFIQHIFMDNRLLQMNNHLLVIDHLLLSHYIHNMSDSCQDYLMLLLMLVKENVSELIRTIGDQLPIVRNISAKITSWNTFFINWFPLRMKQISKFQGDPIMEFIKYEWENGHNTLAYFHITLKRIGSSLFTPDMMVEGVIMAEHLLGLTQGSLTQEWEFLHSLGEHKDENKWHDEEWFYKENYTSIRDWIDLKYRERELMMELEEIFRNFMHQNEYFTSFFYLPPDGPPPITSIDQGNDMNSVQAMNTILQSMGERVTLEVGLKEMEQMIVVGAKGSIITFYYDGELILRLETLRNVREKERK